MTTSLSRSMLALTVSGGLGLSTWIGYSLLWAQSTLRSSAAADSSGGLYISPELGIDANRSVDAALAEPFRHTYEVSVGKPPELFTKTVRNCLDYLPIEAAIYSAGSALREQSLRAQGARCDAYGLLRVAKVAARSSFHDFSFARLPVKALPPGLAVVISRDEESKANEISVQDGSILDLVRDVTLRATSPNTAELATRDWSATLTVYAYGDFLNDGNEEMLLRRDAYAVHGSYRSISVFLLTREKSGLRIVQQRP